MNADERVVAGLDLVAAAVPQALRTACPDLYAVHDPSGACQSVSSVKALVSHVSII